MGRAILITSNKGGVGKSTVSANLSYELFLLGKKVLLLDCDLSARCLDLILGCEDSILYTLEDAANGMEREKAVFTRVRTATGEGCLHFIPSPPSDTGNFNYEGMKSFVRDNLEFYDYIVMDSPPGYPAMMQTCIVLADIAYVVSAHSRTSVRAAERCAQILANNGVGYVKLIINTFHSHGVIKGTHPGIVDMMQSSRTELIGVIPYDKALIPAQEQGLLCSEVKGSISSAPFKNIARRTCGESVPLEKRFAGVKSSDLYYKRFNQ